MIRIIWYTADIQTTGCWRQYVSYVTVLSVSGMSILAYLITVSEWGRLVVIKHEWMERSLSVTLLYTSGLVESVTAATSASRVTGPPTILSAT